MENSKPIYPQFKVEIDWTPIYSAIRGCPEQQWINLFEFLRQEQYPKIGTATTDEERLAISETIKSLNLIQNKFSEMRKNRLDK